MGRYRAGQFPPQAVYARTVPVVESERDKGDLVLYFSFYTLSFD